LCANDGQRLFEAAILGVFTIGSIGSLGGALYAIHLLGAWGVLGFSVFFMFIPIQVGMVGVVQTQLFISSRNRKILFYYLRKFMTHHLDFRESYDSLFKGKL